jgi:hypothetical protein
VADPSDSDGQPSGVSNWRSGGFPIVRACIVLVLFVAATALVLGEIHPPSSKSAAGSVPVTSTSTTRPAHPTTTTTTIPPSRVPVLVANASGVAGAAAAISHQLATAGWDMLAPVNASADVPTSHVYFVAGYQQPAQTIATSLQLPSGAVAPYTTAAPISSIGTADVVVVAGPDIATRATTASTAASTAAG